MSEHASDRNLLVGILALQLDFIQQHELISAMQEWVLDKSSKLEDILLRQNAIDEDRRDFLVAIVQKHIEFHGDDPRNSLASLSSLGPVKEELGKLTDPDLEATLAYAVGKGEDSPSGGDLPSESTASMVDRGSSQFGRYRILRPHAKGGLGQVSVAEDVELHREVALKEILARHAKDPGSHQRFLVEAEVTGRLEHPGIVPVYGLGQDSHGRPFYVMRFIHGDSLKECVDRLYSADTRPQTSEERMRELRKLLRRFIDVCDAVEYAHSRGVLHRDLKPGNIMLGKYGETLVVDWGLAKSIEKTGSHRQSDEPTCIPTSGDDSTKTHMGSVVGTPRYMSPEQAEGRLDEMGPATDVYCLGATLYSILTGQAPFTGKRAKEVLSAVRKGTFSRPGDVNADVPRALEAVCLKAMSVVPTDRYATAGELADEVELWLADEPVSAYREPWTDRAGRFLRRHRTLVTSCTVLLLTAIVALAVISGLIANQNRDLRIARDKAEANRKAAVAEKMRAEQNLATARSIALNIVEIAEKQLSGVTGQEGFRESMMDRAYSMFEQIYQEAPETPGIRLELAKVARMSGNLKRLMRKTDEAEERLERSIALQEPLCKDHPTDGGLLDYLAETLRDRATLMKAIGKLDEADASLGRASQIITQLLEKSPENLDYQRTQGTIELERIGLQIDLLELESALQLATRCADAYKSLAEREDRHPLDHIIMLLAMARRGQILDRLDRGDEARKVFTDAIPLGRQWIQKTPDKNTRYAFARLLHWSAEGSIRSGVVTDQARSQLDEATQLWKNLVEGFPASVGYQYYLGEAWRVRGNMHSLEQQQDEAIAAFEESRAILEPLAEEVDKSDYQDALAQTLTDLAKLKQAAGEHEEAIRLLERAIALRQLASDTTPTSKDLRQKLQQLQRTLDQAREAVR